MTLLERIKAQKPKPAPVKEPEWLRRRRDISAWQVPKDLTGYIR